MFLQNKLKLSVTRDSLILFALLCFVFEDEGNAGEGEISDFAIRYLVDFLRTQKQKLS